MNTTKLCLFNLLLTDLYDVVKPSTDLHSVVNFVLHCVEKYSKLSFFPFSLELAIEAEMLSFKKESASSTGTIELLGPCHDNWRSRGSANTALKFALSNLPRFSNPQNVYSGTLFFFFTIQRFLNLSIDLLDTAYYAA